MLGVSARSSVGVPARGDKFTILENMIIDAQVASLPSMGDFYMYLERAAAADPSIMELMDPLNLAVPYYDGWKEDVETIIETEDNTRETWLVGLADRLGRAYIDERSPRIGVADAALADAFTRISNELLQRAITHTQATADARVALEKFHMHVTGGRWSSAGATPRANAAAILECANALGWPGHLFSRARQVLSKGAKGYPPSSASSRMMDAPFDSILSQPYAAAVVSTTPAFGSAAVVSTTPAFGSAAAAASRPSAGIRLPSYKPPPSVPSIFGGASKVWDENASSSSSQTARTSVGAASYSAAMLGSASKQKKRPAAKVDDDDDEADGGDGGGDDAKTGFQRKPTAELRRAHRAELMQRYPELRQVYTNQPDYGTSAKIGAFLNGVASTQSVGGVRKTLRQAIIYDMTGESSKIVGKSPRTIGIVDVEDYPYPVFLDAEVMRAAMSNISPYGGVVLSGMTREETLALQQTRGPPCRMFSCLALPPAYFETDDAPAVLGEAIGWCCNNVRDILWKAIEKRKNSRSANLKGVPINGRLWLKEFLRTLINTVNRCKTVFVDGRQNAAFMQALRRTGIAGDGMAKIMTEVVTKSGLANEKHPSDVFVGSGDTLDVAFKDLLAQVRACVGGEEGADNMDVDPGAPTTHQDFAEESDPLFGNAAADADADPPPTSTTLRREASAKSARGESAPPSPATAQPNSTTLRRDASYRSFSGESAPPQSEYLPAIAPAAPDPAAVSRGEADQGEGDDVGLPLPGRADGFSVRKPTSQQRSQPPRTPVGADDSLAWAGVYATEKKQSGGERAAVESEIEPRATRSSNGVSQSASRKKPSLGRQVVLR